MKTRWLMALLAGLALALPAHADEPTTTQTNDEMASIASDYNVQETQITDLRDKGWSWNEIGDALAVSKRSGQPLEEIVSERDSGMSWNQISDKYGFKFSEVQSDARHVAKEAKKADKGRHHNEAIRRTGTSSNPQGHAPGTAPTGEPGTMSPYTSPQNPPQPQTP